jgi:IQ calmodulin-binding motif.
MRVNLRFCRNTYISVKNVENRKEKGAILCFPGHIGENLIHFSSQFTPKQLNDAAIKFQSLYRGYITRKYTILPNSILKPCICNQINAFTKNARRKIGNISSELYHEKKFFIKLNEQKM